MNFSHLLCKSASFRFLIKDETDSLKLKIELIWKGENQFWTIHVFSSQGRWIKAMALMKLLTGWELLVLTRPSQIPQESGCCRWLHSATMSAMILIKKTDMDPLQMRISEIKKPSETNRRLPWACFSYHRTRRKHNKACPGRSRVGEAVVTIDFVGDTIPENRNISAMLWAVLLLSRTPPGNDSGGDVQAGSSIKQCLSQ